MKAKANLTIRSTFGVIFNVILHFAIEFARQIDHEGVKEDEVSSENNTN